MDSPIVTALVFIASPFLFYGLMRWRKGITGGGWTSYSADASRQRAKNEADNADFDRFMRDVQKMKRSTPD